MKSHVDLFSGIGGFSLAAGWAGYETVLFVEKDDYCQKVLKKHWPNVPIIGDINDAIAEGAWKGRTGERIDLLTAGVPCQPASVAGKQRGEADDRWLWPQTLEAIRQLKPTWCLLENVRGLLALDNGMAFERVLVELEAIGYEVQPLVVGAVSVNAPHRRDRVWIMAHDARLGCGPRRTERERLRGESTLADGREDVADTWQFAGGTGLRQVAAVVDGYQPGDGGAAADSEGPGLEGADTTGHPCSGRRTDESGPGRRQADWWSVESELGRVAHGIPRRVDRLRCLGNAIVPQVAYQIIRCME